MLYGCHLDPCANLDADLFIFWFFQQLRTLWSESKNLILPSQSQQRNRAHNISTYNQRSKLMRRAGDWNRLRKRSFDQRTDETRNEDRTQYRLPNRTIPNPPPRSSIVWIKGSMSRQLFSPTGQQSLCIGSRSKHASNTRRFFHQILPNCSSSLQCKQLSHGCETIGRLFVLLLRR
jgi:hypothetical protein